MRFAFAFLFIASSLLAADYSSDDPPVAKAPIQGRLLSREVYDLAGKKVGLEEYSDAGAVEVKAKPKAKPRATMPTEYKQFGSLWYKSVDGGDWTYCAECNPSQGAAASGPIVQSPMLSAPVYYAMRTYRVAPRFGIGAGFNVGRFGAGVSAGGG